MKQRTSIRLLFCLLILLSAPFALLAQNKISQYEYWFNLDYSARVVTNVTPSQVLHLNTNIPTSGLPVGLNTLHLRFRDDSLNYSHLISHFFFRMHETAPSSNSSISSYEYWFDGDYNSKVDVPLTPTSDYQLNTMIPAGHLTVGLHTLHVRFRDDSLLWSQVCSGFFYQLKSDTMPSALPEKRITAAEYWFDDDFAGRVAVPFSGNSVQEHLITGITSSGLPFGLHRFNIRFRDNAGQWSSVSSQHFFKTNQINGTSPVNRITAWQYWFDADPSGAVTQQLSTPVQDYFLLNNLSMVLQPKGLHQIHFRFLDESGMWSSVVTDTVMKVSMPYASFSWTTAASCDSTVVTFQNQSIDGDIYNWNFGDGQTSTLKDPVHTYYNPGSYPVTLTINDTLTNGTSIVYYYVNVDAYARTTLNVATCGSYLSPGGTQLWTTSGVYSDTVPNPPACDSIYTVNLTIYTEYPVGLLQHHDTICYGDSFTFPDGSVMHNITSSMQYNSILQTVNFCDSIITSSLVVNDTSGSTVQAVACGSYTLNGQVYTTTGNYFQHLTNTNGCDSTIYLKLTVYQYPDPNLGVDTILCYDQGQTLLTLDAGPAHYFLWSDGSTAQTLLVDTIKFPPHIQHQIWVKATNGVCDATDTIGVLFDNCSGILEYPGMPQLVIFPNPTEAVIYIIGDLRGGFIQLYNLTGKLLKEIYPDQDQMSVDVSDFVPGTYLLKFSHGPFQTYRKIIRM
jgi:PKD repeat protein